MASLLIMTNFGWLWAYGDVQIKQVNLWSKSDWNLDNLKEKNYVDGEIIVKFKPSEINLKSSSGISSMNSLADNKWIQIKESLSNNNIAVMTLDDNQNFDQKLSELNADPNIEYAQPNYIYHTMSTWFDDTYSWDLRWLPQIDWYSAYELFSGNINTTGTLVAVVDAGVAYDHPDLAVNMRDGSSCKSNTGLQINGCLHGYDFADNDNDPYPVRSDHGTHVAGTIAAAANNGIWIIWVNPHAQIMAIRVGDDSMTTLAIANGIDFARHNGAKIINASFGAYDYDQYMYDAVQSFGLSGGLFIAAAGNAAINHAVSGVSYPCGYDLDNIICVAATNSSDGLASFSDYGAVSVDLWAPGTNIYSTVIDLLENDMYTNNFSWSLWDVITGWTDFSRWSQNNMAMWWYSWFVSTYITWIQDSYIDKIFNLTGYLWYNLSIKTYCDTPSDSNQDFLEISFLSWWDEIVLIQTNKYYWPYINQSSWINLIDYTWWLSTVFYREEFDLDVNLFQNQDLQIRARRYSDDIADQTDNMWCMIDYIQLEWISENGLAYWYKNWTSMATPHVVWLASLAWSSSPWLSYSQIKNIIIDSWDPLAALSWTTVSGKRINAQNTLLTLGYPYVQIYPTIWNILSWQWIQTNLDAVNYLNLTGFSWLYFSAYSGSTELWRITFLTWLDLTDTGTQDFLQNDLPMSIWMEQWKIWFAPWSGFVWKNARLQMNLPISFSGILDSINSGSFIVRSGANWTWDIVDNDMITAVFTGACTDVYCPIYLDVMHFTSFEIKPQLLQVNIQSNNTSNNSYAKSWDSVTLTWTWSEALTGVSATINGLTGLVTGANTSRYTTLQVTWSTVETGITFAINYSNLSGATWNVVTSTTNSSLVIVDRTAPILSWASSVGNTTTQTPTYSFTSNETGTISYSWACTSATTGAISGTNNITFNTLSNATYNNCIIYVDDIASNQSSINVPSFTVNYVPPSSGGWWGGGWWSVTPTCTDSKLICSGWFYVLKTWQNCQWWNLGDACTLSGTNTWNDLSWLNLPSIITGSNVLPKWNILGSTFNNELNQAYLYAYGIGITTMASIQQANMTGTLQRSHLAKMIVNYANKVLNLQPDTSKNCNFSDIWSQNAELRWYIKLACQMWLMWVGIENFDPTGKVTRAQFGTILSRALWWDKHNSTSTDYYSKHLNELKKIWIMNKIDSPYDVEVRWWVMLMMMRAGGSL